MDLDWGLLLGDLMWSSWSGGRGGRLEIIGGSGCVVLLLVLMISVC